MVKLYNNEGFTIVDVIIAGAVISILVVMSFPMVSDFLLLQNEKEEEEIQAEILRTMNVMAKEDYQIPVGNDIEAFANEAQGYGNYVAADIVQDSFKANRYYVGVQGQEVYRDATFDVHYAVLYSTGVDRCWGDGDSCDTGVIAASVTALLGNNAANYAAKFKEIEPPVGDFLIKFTDRQYQYERYKETSHRLKRITDALLGYGQLKKYEGIADGVSPTLIFFPQSKGPVSDSQMSLLTYDNVESDIEAELNATVGVGVTDVILNNDVSTTDKERRRESMIALTRVLGLPDKYCCNALKTFIDSNGDKQEEGFFYYSNPRARIDIESDPPVCGVIASTVGDRKLPPRITVDEDPCGK